MADAFVISFKKKGEGVEEIQQMRVPDQNYYYGDVSYLYIWTYPQAGV
jgi:hypothetical protein